MHQQKNLNNKSKKNEKSFNSFNSNFDPIMWME